MLQETVEGKWIASFNRVLALNGIGPGTPVAILAESQSRPVLLQLAALSCYELGAEFSTIVLPTPEHTAPVPVRSTGTSNAIQNKRHVVEACKHVEIIVDVTVEGLLHAEEWPEIEESGTRLLVVCNEHPEILERTEPKVEHGEKVSLGIEMLRQAKKMVVTSEVGTETVRLAVVRLALRHRRAGLHIGQEASVCVSPVRTR